MNRERFQQIEEIFSRAIELPEEARGAFLDRACHGDSALRHEVELMLAYDRVSEEGKSPNPIDRLPGLVADAVAATSLPLPEKIGDYRILEKLGEGGMGMVYLAEQDDPRRRVALKMIRPDMVSPGLSKRFQLEVEVLGRLQHPGIAQIHEAGRIELGATLLPYFAMEYVPGLPLLRYIEEHDLNTRSRLELMARICDAAHHAHLNGIVHRDLKPDNVLVVDPPTTTAVGDAQEFADLGQPKVLDFGVARATESDVQMTTLQTDVGKLVGTITYMSPEQVMGDSLRIDQRSDIYSLGTLLYEVLAGHPPFDLRSKPIPEAVRIIREEDPTRLGSIRTVFRGDIDTIVCKALEKNRVRRYGTAADLAADIRRYLAHEPIKAHPPSAIYELKKFTRRHKGLVGGLVLSFLILVVGIASSLLFAFRAASNADKAMRTAYRLKINTAEECGDTDPLQVWEHLEEVPLEQRGWEWQHHYARIFSHLGEQTGDRYLRYSSTLACRADGSLVAALNRAGGIEIVDLITGEVQTRLQDEHDHVVLCLSRDATLLASWCQEEHKISLWDLERGICLRRQPFEYPDPVCRINQANSLWAIRSSKGKSLTLIDLATGDPSWQFDHKTDARHDFALSPFVGRVATEVNKKLHLYSRSGEIIAANQQKELLSAIKFSPDGKQIALGHIHQTITILDGATLEVQQVLHGHSSEVTAVAFSPDGDYLASASNDFTVRIWHLASGRTVRVLPALTDEGMNSLVFSSDGELLAAGHAAGARIWKWQEDSRRLLKGHESYVYHVVFSPDGATLASAGFSDDVRLWDPFTSELLAVFPATYPQGGLVFDSDGSRMIYISNATDFLGACKFSAMDTDAAVPITTPRSTHDEAFLKALHENRDYLKYASGARFSDQVGETRVVNADGSLIADGYGKMEVHLIDGATRKPIKTIGRHDAQLYSVALNHNSSLVASGDGDGVIKVWEVESGAWQATLEGHIGRVFSIDFSPDGQRIASAGNDGNIVLWDCQTYERVAMLREHTSYVHSVRFSPDGTMLASASGDGTVRIWDTVLPSERLEQIRRDRILAQKARPIVVRLLDQYEDPLDVADHLRNNAELEDDLRRAARRYLLKQSSGYGVRTIPPRFPELKGEPWRNCPDTVPDNHLPFPDPPLSLLKIY